MSLRWDDVQILLTLAEAGSISAAAPELGLTAATLSRRLKGLEAALDLKLFIRNANRVTLTEAGQRLAEAAQPLRQGADAVLRAADALRTPDRPALLRLSTTGSVALFLARHWGAVQAAAPEVPVLLLADKTAANLARREADLALRMRRLPEEGDLVARTVGRLAFSLYAAPAALDRDGQARQVIGLPPARRTGSQAQFVESWAGDRPIPLRLATVALRLEAARQGLGATLLPCVAGDAERALIRLIPPPPTLTEDIYLLCHRDLSDTRPVRQLSAALVGLFRRHQAALLGEGVV